MNSPLRILFVDHRDSFSENLVAAFRARGCDVDIYISERAHDTADVSLDDQSILNAHLFSYHGLVLSPGPGRPEHYPQTHALLERWFTDRPLLGVCLGLQILLARDGYELSLVSLRPVHGRREKLDHMESSQWLSGVGTAGRAVFYNSWAVAEKHLHGRLSDWRACSRSGNFVAACEHKSRPWLGVQYHPESFITEHGGLLLDAFVALLRARASM